MKHTVILTFIVLSALFILYPNDNSLKNHTEKGQQRQVKPLNKTESSYLPQQKSIKNEQKCFLRRELRKSYACSEKAKSFDILPTIKNSYKSFDIMSYAYSGQNRQPMFAENIIMNYRDCRVKPFERGKICDDKVVETGAMQFVDFGNAGDLPNNPSAPIGDSIVPLMICAICEIEHIHYKNQQRR